MAFTIRNHGTALFEDQSEVDAVDWSIVLDALNGSGVYTGCVASAQTTPDGSLLVSAGTYRVTGANKTFAGGSVSIVSGSANADGSTALAADANWARYDLVVLNPANQVGVIHGVTDPPTFANGIISNPVFPTYDTSTQVVIAAVYVTPGLTAIASGQFTPKDVRISVNAFHDQAHQLSGANHTGEVSNAQHGVRSIASAHAAAHITFTPASHIAATEVQSALEEIIAEELHFVTFAKQGTVAMASGALRWYNDSGRTLTFISARASVGTAPTGSTLIVDVHKDGTTIFTTQSGRPTIAISGFTNKSTAMDVTTIANGSYLTVDIDQPGSTIAGADLTVQITMKG